MTTALLLLLGILKHQRLSLAITKRDTKHFSEQSFRHDLYLTDWSMVSLIPDVELAWSFFLDMFMPIIDKHAPFRKYRVKAGITPGSPKNYQI